MARENRSPSYQRDRNECHRWIDETEAGQLARRNLMLHAPGGDASKIFDDGEWIDHEDLLREHLDGVMVAKENMELQKDFDRVRQGYGYLRSGRVCVDCSL